MTTEVKDFLLRSNVIRYMDDYIIQLMNDIRSIIPERIIDCIDSEFAGILSDIIQKGMDTCLIGASGAIAEWEGQSPNIPDAYIAEAFIHAGDMIWRRFVTLFNLDKYPAVNTNNGENYLTLEPHGFVLCMMGIDRDQRRILIPAIEDILIEAFNSAMTEMQEIYDHVDEACTPKDNVSVPPSGQYELRDKIFEDCGISELIRLFKEIGTYHPDGKYDEDWKVEYHDRIEDLMDQLFRKEEL